MKNTHIDVYSLDIIPAITFYSDLFSARVRFTWRTGVRDDYRGDWLVAVISEMQFVFQRFLWFSFAIHLGYVKCSASRLRAHSSTLVTLQLMLQLLLLYSCGASMILIYGCYQIGSEWTLRRLSSYGSVHLRCWRKLTSGSMSSPPTRNDVMTGRWRRHTPIWCWPWSWRRPNWLESDDKETRWLHRP